MGTSDVDLIIIGAGAAGIGAAKRSASIGLSFKLLEASHRVGGRAYTELIGPKRQPFDLGCHWLCSANLNPMVKFADDLGFTYAKSGYGGSAFYVDGRRETPAERDSWEAFYDSSYRAVGDAVAAGREGSVADLTPREDRWTPFFDYIFSLDTTVDPDQASAIDTEAYNDTQENWAIREGYGALIARFGANVPVELNTQVLRLDWSGAGVRADTPKGTVCGRAAVVTVSTGILGAGDIRFDPALPADKLEAIHHLPLGCQNRIALQLDRDVFGADALDAISVLPSWSDDVPMRFRIRPFGYDYVVAMTGGRHGDRLERAGTEAAADLATENLKKMFGNDIGRKIAAHTVTAWGDDPWVRGANAMAVPGHAGARAILREPLAERLFFAGEATHASFFSTCHGAYLSGIDAVDATHKILSGGKAARTGS